MTIVISYFTEKQDVFSRNNNGNTSTLTSSSISQTAEASSSNPMVDDIIPWRLWLIKAHKKLHEIPWYQLKHVKWMNKRATAKTAYVPTDVSTYIQYIV